MLLRRIGYLLSLLAATTRAIELNVDEDDSIREVTGSIAWSMMKFYTGNFSGDVPGNLPSPYYWWICGAMFGSLIDYWRYTGDDTYNPVVLQGLLHQSSDTHDYMPSNQTMSMGNDDQGFWALTAMQAAEAAFPNPPEGQPQWITITQNVFNEFVGRWDELACGGGLRWQTHTFSAGYFYRNTITNGLFFNLAARLARYTGNETYTEWAETIYDWQKSVTLISDKWEARDGVTAKDGESCHDMDVVEWSYNNGVNLYGCAVMYDITDGSQKWKDCVDGMMEHAMTKFVWEGVLYEQWCEPSLVCNIDQRTFKGYLARWMAGTAQLVPDHYDAVNELMRSSAEAAAASCVGSPAPAPDHPAWAGHPNTACGFQWTTGEFDGSYGVGEQMSALSVIMYTMAERPDGPVTNDTGGTSHGDPDDFISDEERNKLYRDITMADRVGAGFLTTFMIAGVLGGTYFMVSSMLEDR